MANFAAADYLQNRGGEEELRRQARARQEEEARKNSFWGGLKDQWGKFGKAVGGNLLSPKTLVMGPMGSVASGALEGSGLMSLQEQKGLAMNVAAAALSKGMGSYMGGKAANGAKFQDSAGLGGMTEEQYQAYLDSIARGG